MGSATKVAIGLCLAAMLLMGWQLYHLFPAEAWRRALAETIANGLPGPSPNWLELALGLAILGVLWVQWKQRRSGRLLLDEHWLRLDSGVPLLRHWLDWRLSLDDVRSGQTPLLLNGMAIGSNALRMYSVGWGLSGLPRFHPAAWIPKGANNVCVPASPTGGAGSDDLPPHRPLGYIGWRHPDNAAWLQQRFNALPLVNALRQQGIELPPLDRARGNGAGVDLLRYGRLRSTLTGVLPTAFALGALLQHLARHQHYFSPWSMATWATIALLIAVLTGVWLWRDEPAQGMHRRDAWSIRMAQGLVAILVALVVPWGLQAMPLALAHGLVTPLNVDFVLDRDHHRLVPEPGAPVSKSVLLDGAAPFWATQDNGSLQPLPVRVGPGGMWQQYDVEALNKRIADFFDQQNRTPLQATKARKLHT
jgi:hypothetical protein